MGRRRKEEREDERGREREGERRVDRFGLRFAVGAAQQLSAVFFSLFCGHKLLATGENQLDNNNNC